MPIKILLIIVVISLLFGSLIEFAFSRRRRKKEKGSK